MKFTSLDTLLANPPDVVGSLWGDSLLPCKGLTLLHSGSKIGKAQTLNSRILTPTGFKQLKHLSVGDMVIGSNGKPTRIMQLHPANKLPTYWVKFKDGTIVTCTADHLWNIRSKQKVKTVDTLEVQRLLAKKRLYVQPVSPVQFDKQQELTLDPYLLGVLLGDGCFRMRTPCISFGDPEILSIVEQTLPPNIHIKAGETAFYLSSGRGSKKNVITKHLEDMALWNAGSYSKFIPSAYMLASVKDRFSLLQGLMDTDGTVNKNANGARGLSFCTVSPVLAKQVQELIHSLGGVCSLNWRKTFTYKDGEKRAGKAAAILVFRLPPCLGTPFRLSRKLKTYIGSTTARKKLPVRRIIDVFATGLSEDCRCITVEADDGLYVTEGYVLTHNSMLSMNLALAGAKGEKEFLGQKIANPFSTLIFQGEIHQRGVYERFNQMVQKSEMTGEQLARIYINHDRSKRLSDDATFLEFWEEVRKLCPDLVVLDPLAHVLTTNENDNAVVGAMLERLAALRDDPGCAILLIHHDAKVNEATAMRSPQQRARGADRLNADPDCILSLVPGARLASGPTGKLHVASRYGRTVPPFTIALNEETLWFEQFVDRGDPVQIVKWIEEKGVDRVSGDVLVAMVEAGWGLKDERQHRAAKRYIAKAEAEGLIYEETIDGAQMYVVRKGES